MWSMLSLKSLMRMEKKMIRKSKFNNNEPVTS